ncbi:MAG: hypothetical protein CMA10_04580 [Euryarchaeota archaeon]|nr:hypothetical protein [Euryarchaeota archaeon]|tara:strand:+ start:1316 stop:2581 length:1266 start_codon:yes stop_codon:yes gene_type:complete
MRLERAFWLRPEDIAASAEIWPFADNLNNDQRANAAARLGIATGAAVALAAGDPRWLAMGAVAGVTAGAAMYQGDTLTSGEQPYGAMSMPTPTPMFNTTMAGGTNGTANGTNGTDGINGTADGTNGTTVLTVPSLDIERLSQPTLMPNGISSNTSWKSYQKIEAMRKDAYELIGEAPQQLSAKRAIYDNREWTIIANSDTFLVLRRNVRGQAYLKRGDANDLEGNEVGAHYLLESNPAGEFSYGGAYRPLASQAVTHDTDYQQGGRKFANQLNQTERAPGAYDENKILIFYFLPPPSFARGADFKKVMTVDPRWTQPTEERQRNPTQVMPNSKAHFALENGLSQGTANARSRFQKFIETEMRPDPWADLDPSRPEPLAILPGMGPTCTPEMTKHDNIIDYQEVYKPNNRGRYIENYDDFYS